MFKFSHSLLNENENSGSDFGIQLNERQKNILNLLIEDGHNTAIKLAGLLGETQRTVETDLSFLRKNGYIEKRQRIIRSPWIVIKSVPNIIS